MPLRSSARLALVAGLALAAAPAPEAQGIPLAAGDSLRDDRRFSWYDRGPYRTEVPRPETLLGYELGQVNTQYAHQERVLLAIADAAKDRVRVEEIATTPERRRMRLYIVSHPDNIARLDAIRGDLDRIADPRKGGDLDATAGRTPAVVWFSGSVHGNESPGFETSMQLLYQLAASNEPATLEALRNSIVIINPSSNPDGHERFAVWYTSVGVGAPSPIAAEKREPWTIQGRFNHYRINMNRDLIATTQAEVRGIVRGMLRWHPMVAADLHGQVSTYHFPPAARPVNRNITGGDLNAKWMEIVGAGMAKAFDRYGWLYYSRDYFDLYYPGYYDTWPALNGAIGMTFETDGGGHRGILTRREDGSLLSFRDGIAKHYVASMATLEATASRRAERVRDYLAFRRQAIAAGRSEAMKAVVIVPGKDPVRAGELVAALQRAGVEVKRLPSAVSSGRARSYADGRSASRRFDAGAYVVDLAQPQGRVAKAILEPEHELDPEFARSQREKFLRNQRRGSSADAEGYEFYDIAAWSLPVAYGVEAYWTEDAIAGGELLAGTGDALLDTTRRAILGEVIPADVASGITGGARAQSAYVFSPERTGSAVLAAKLLGEGFRVATMNVAFEAAGRSWPRGSFIAHVGRNAPTLHDRLDSLARQTGVEVTPVNTAFTVKGQYGVGSEALVPLTPPRIAVLGDEGIAHESYGAVWYTMEKRWGLPFTPVSWGGVLASLRDVNVLVIPDANPGVIAQRLGKAGADRLKEWMRSGGTLVAFRGAAAWAATEEVNITSARRVEAAADAKPTARADTGAARPADSTSAEALIPVASPGAQADNPADIPGSHFDVVLDRTHWLTAGYEQPRMTMLMGGDTFLKLSKDGSNVGVFAPNGPLFRAGFTWPNNTERLLRNTAAVIHEPVGAGHAVLFASDPMFRAWWRALDKMVLNAMVMGPGF